jgi:hypothetical protein
MMMPHSNGGLTMNTLIVMFFESEEMLKNLPHAAMQNFVVPMAFKERKVLAMVIGRHSVGELCAELSPVTISRIVQNEAIVSMADAIGVVVDGRQNGDSRNAFHSAKNNLRLQTVELTEMCFELLDTLPPIWSGALQTLSWPKLP